MDIEDACQLTVLTSVSMGSRPANRLQKKFTLSETGLVVKTNFQMPTLYRVTLREVRSIDDLAAAIVEAAKEPRNALIRGLPATRKQVVPKRGEFFSEHPDGTHWLMLDFDDLALPEEIDPLSTEAIEWAIAKLPAEFQNVTYFFQHSSSAGVLERGQPLKKGLNVHVFFWLSRRVTGAMLNSHLKLHCLRTGFFTIGEDTAGSVRLRCGYDPALFQPVQAHYIAPPDIGEGVECRLSPEQRQGLVRKAGDQIEVPELPADIVAAAGREHYRRVQDYQRANGYIRIASQTRVGSGVATAYHYVNPGRQTQGGRPFKEAKLVRNGEIVVLYLDDESSPGSWFVVKGPNAHMAYKHGGEKMLLKDLSTGAHAYVRDDLRWFDEVPGYTLKLTDQGFLPPLSGFARAKVSLVLAPTGSGKTKAIIDWVRLRHTDFNVVVYAAPTIALINQMQRDLRDSGVFVHHYKDVEQRPSHGVIVTTNKSLTKILHRLRGNVTPFALVVDEIHVGLDEFLKRAGTIKRFEDALVTSRKTFLLTGTLTDIQRNKIPDVVGHALSGLTEQDYCRYEFLPVKRNPVCIRATEAFDSDFMNLLEELKDAAGKGEPLPRVVLILPTSKMNAFRVALESKGLTDQALVVSRPENFEREIEEARIGTQPILIVSPLFAVGLNFDLEADVFWCSFTHLNVDENQIVQTLNRANRGTKVADVRIYGNVHKLPAKRSPNVQRLTGEIRASLAAEGTLQGVLDQHTVVDLAAYKVLRKSEKNSNVALNRLVENDAIQNFFISEIEAEPTIDAKAAKVLKEFRKDANAAYKADIERVAETLSYAEIGELLLGFDRLNEERRLNWSQEQLRLEKERTDEEFGLVMNLCGVSVSQAKNVKVQKLRRLFTWIPPWMSSQYDRELVPEWMAVEAQKSSALAVVVEWLEKVRDQLFEPNRMAAALTIGKSLSNGFLALSNDDVEYIEISRRFDALRRRRAEVKQIGSKQQRAAVQLEALSLLGDLLEPCGVLFARQKIGREVVVDYSQLIVPAHWPLEEMRLALLRRAASLTALPSGSTEAVMLESEHSAYPPVSIAFCQGCVHLHQLSCAVGRTVNWLDVPNPRGDECDAFKAFKPRL